MTKNVLVVDIGGSHIKARASGRRTEAKVDSGPDLTPRQMVERVLGATDGWRYDAVSIGYPGPVVNGRIDARAATTSGVDGRDSTSSARSADPCV